MARNTGEGSKRRRVTGTALALLLAVAVLVYGYGMAGLLGGAIPANRDWRPPAEGVHIFVEDNGIHTGIVLPKVAAGVDWRGLVRPEDLADPRYAGWPYLSFGWGDRAFYLNTPTWWDVRPGTVLAAAIGSDSTVVHVDHLPQPRPGKTVREIVLRPEEYRRLAAFIRATFAVGQDGRAPSVHGYGGWDAFYDAKGRYSAIRTCNAWSGDALRHAGVRVGAWTPFPATVMAWF